MQGSTLSGRARLFASLPSIPGLLKVCAATRTVCADRISVQLCCAFESEFDPEVVPVDLDRPVTDVKIFGGRPCIESTRHKDQDFKLTVGDLMNVLPGRCAGGPSGGPKEGAVCDPSGVEKTAFHQCMDGLPEMIERSNLLHVPEGPRLQATFRVELLVMH